MNKVIIDRLGLAYVRLSNDQWDDILGPKPEDYDRQYACDILDAIESIIGEANVSRYWWIYEIGRPEEEWFRWYTVDRIAVQRSLEHEKKQNARKHDCIPALAVLLLSAMIAIASLVLRGFAGT